MNLFEQNAIIGLLLVLTAGVVIAFLTSSTQNAVSLPDQNSEASVVGTTSDSGRQLSVTDGTKHTIPLDEILSGGPPKDGIPSIDEPSFVSPETTRDWLPSDAQGIGVEIDDQARFYPYAILVWHEIVNDSVAGKPITVTYCPLCMTGIVFDPVVDDEILEFGVSGRLWQSNLLMYDRTENPDTESLWSQVLGEAVVGPKAGTQLAVVPSTITRLNQWVQAHPETEVLARPESSRRNYQRDPYEGYYESSRVSFGAQFDDERLDPKRLVYGISVDGVHKAYPADALPTGTSTDTVNEKKITITKNSADTVVFTDNSQERIPHITGFWFSWAAVHPETEIYQAQQTQQ